MPASIDPLLPYIQAGSVGTEIGVAEGDSALALFLHGVKFLVLIDPWAPHPEYLEGGTPEGHEAKYRAAMEKLAPYASRHSHLRMPSAAAARYVQPASQDFVWVDGNHQYEWAKSDLELYWPKIKAGGLLCGHDYCNAPPTCGVKDAVDEFVRGMGLRLELPLPCWLVRKP